MGTTLEKRALEIVYDARIYIYILENMYYYVCSLNLSYHETCPDRKSNDKTCLLQLLSRPEAEEILCKAKISVVDLDQIGQVSVPKVAKVVEPSNSQGNSLSTTGDEDDEH